ncbi:MAG: class I SAM-dependent methyltransferase [Campylobacterales bacterium]
MIRKNNLQAIDFEALYCEQKAKTDFKPKEKADWDKRAPQMRTQLMQSIYNDAFLKAIDLSDCESLLDVGCGPGNLCLPLAARLKAVHAMDFSGAMLEALRQNAAELGATNAQTHELSWEDDWSALPRCDAVIASRSMEVSDMGEALRKLNAQANKRVYVTYKLGGSFIEPEILAAIGREIEPKPDYIYIVNILYNMGINATVNFLPSEGKGFNYQDEEAFVKSVLWSLGELSEMEEKRLRDYYQKRVAANDLSDRPVKWVLIGWEKE